MSSCFMRTDLKWSVSSKVSSVMGPVARWLFLFLLSTKWIGTKPERDVVKSCLAFFSYFCLQTLKMINLNVFYQYCFQRKMWFLWLLEFLYKFPFIIYIRLTLHVWSKYVFYMPRVMWQSNCAWVYFFCVDILKWFC